jgi:hypothetical protein
MYSIEIQEFSPLDTKPCITYICTTRCTFVSRGRRGRDRMVVGLGFVSNGENSCISIEYIFNVMDSLQGEA